jgi:dihydroorotase
MHAEWRDVETALNATTRIINIARKVKRPVHILHVTTAEEMLFLKNHKDVATVEVLPQHLTLSAPDAYNRLGTLAQMNPPIRDERHKLALWDAVAGGLVDCIGSDHAPHTLEEKRLPYPQSPSGLTGVQTLVPIMLDHVHSGRLSLQQFVDLTSAGPARVYGTARKGRIALGYDADFTIVDLNARREIRNDWIASKSAWTPYHGQKVCGWPIATVIRGNVVMQEDELIGVAQGNPVRFIATL